MDPFKGAREWLQRRQEEELSDDNLPEIDIEPRLLKAARVSQLIARMSTRDPEGFEALLTYLASRLDSCSRWAEQNKSERDEFMGGAREIRFILDVLEKTQDPSAQQEE